MSQILATQGLGLSRDFVLKNNAGETVSVSGSDKIRAKITREGQTPKLTVTSGTTTSNGSSFTVSGGQSGSHRLRLDASDLTFSPGVYSLYLEFFDSGDGSEWKTVCRHVFVLLET